MDKYEKMIISPYKSSISYKSFIFFKRRRYTAGQIILEEAGGRLTQWTGQGLSYYGDTTALASNGILHQEMMDRLKDFV